MSAFVFSSMPSFIDLTSNALQVTSITLASVYRFVNNQITGMFSIPSLMMLPVTSLIISLILYLSNYRIPFKYLQGIAETTPAINLAVIGNCQR